MSPKTVQYSETLHNAYEYVTELHPRTASSVQLLAALALQCEELHLAFEHRNVDISPMIDVAGTRPRRRIWRRTGSRELSRVMAEAASLVMESGRDVVTPADFVRALAARPDAIATMMKVGIGPSDLRSIAAEISR